MIDRGGSSKPNYQPNDSHTLKKTASTKSSAGTKKNTKTTSSGTKKKTKTTKVVTKTTKSNKSTKSKTTKSNKSTKSKTTKSKVTKSNKPNTAVKTADALKTPASEKVNIVTAEPINATSIEDLGAIPADKQFISAAKPSTVTSTDYSTGKGSITGPTFVGMNANNVPQFHKAIDVYRDKIQSIIDKMVVTPNTEGALKGAVASAALEYLAAAKDLLNKYVAAIDMEKEEIDRAQAEWEARAGEIAKEVISDSDDIRSQSGGIVLD